MSTPCPSCNEPLLKHDRTFVGVCVECGADVDLHFVIQGNRGKLYAFSPSKDVVHSGGELDDDGRARVMKHLPASDPSASRA